MRLTRWLPVVLIAALAAVSSTRVTGQAPTPEVVTAGELPFDLTVSEGSAISALRAAAASLDARVATGELRRTAIDADALVSGRIHERLAQFYRGVPVFGGDATRQLNNFGQTTSVFSVFYPDIAIDVTPTLSADEGRALAILANGAGAVLREDATLIVLPIQGGYRLAWAAAASATDDTLVHRTFIDAVTGTTLERYVDTWTQAAVGKGTGLEGDALAINSRAAAGTFEAVDLVTPGGPTTFDLGGDATRAAAIVNGGLSPLAADIATSATDTWNGSVASAHAYAGLTLDYLRRRFHRDGLDNHDLPLRLFVGLARPADATTAGLLPSRALLFDGAFYAGGGDVFFGAGSVAADGTVSANPYAAGLDVVAHELTHGVTRFTSNLVYQFESGALNEAFSDIIGAGVEFDAQPLGTGPAHADWLFGEDIGSTPIRSFIDPNALGAPDHYSLKRIVTLDHDNGAVHANASIVDHMFYLAVMGGTNRVSGLTVHGVGFADSATIEQAVFRAFTEELPRRATFTMARGATIQAARDLFGIGSPAETALTEAWLAVGVN